MAKEGRRARQKCVHRYVFETPRGATVRGVCKLCGRVRRLPSAFNGAGRPLRHSKLARRANQPQLVRSKDRT